MIVAKKAQSPQAAIFEDFLHYKSPTVFCRRVNGASNYQMNQGVDIAISLIFGLLMTAALQLVLTILGIALGFSLVDWSAGGEPEQESQSGSGSLPISHLAGFGIALSLSLVLFVASLLTTEFQPDC